MNIIVLNDYGYVQGGASQVAIHSSRGLAEAGHSVCFVYAVGPIDPLLMHPNIRTVDLGQYDLLSNPSRFNAALTGIWNMEVRKIVDDLASQFDPRSTIVHVHTWVKALSCSAVYSFVSKQFPVVLTLHDYFTVCPNGGFYDYQRKKACSLRPLSGACFMSNCDVRNYPQKLWRFARSLVTKCSGLPGAINHFVYVSDFSRNILAPHLPSGASFWKVSNPIDATKDGPADPALHSEYTFVGRLSAEKGVRLFAEVAQQLKISCKFVGSGELEEDVKAIVPGATFTGWAGRGDVQKHLRTSRAIIFPSEWYETQGMVISEAAAAGVPCVVSDGCAGRDFVEDGITGLLFGSGNPASLAAAITSLEDSSELVRALGRNAYSRYWAKPATLTRHVEDIVSCYESVLSKQAVRSA